MTVSKEYKNADHFERKIMREIKAGIDLRKRGWIGEDMPANIHTLTSVLEWYRKFRRDYVRNFK